MSVVKYTKTLPVGGRDTRVNEVLPFLLIGGKGPSIVAVIG